MREIESSQWKEAKSKLGIRVLWWYELVLVIITFVVCREARGFKEDTSIGEHRHPSSVVAYDENRMSKS